MSTSVGNIHYDLDLNTSKFDAKAGAVKSKLSTFGTGLKALGKSSAIATASIAAFGAVLSPFIRDAAKRVDIMNNFPKVMSNMGISAKEAEAGIKKIDEGIQGLPTSLNDATLAVQRLTTKTQNVNKATDIFLALNNAIIAGGAPMELQSTAMEQFSQAFAKGKPDMMEWRSMLSAMPAQLNQVAKSMKLKNADELGVKLRDGTISMEDFGKELIKLNSKGVGGLPTLAEQAKNASGGLQTAMANAKIAITRGIANIMKAIGSSNIANAITKIGKSIEKAFTWISNNLDIVAVFVGTILAAAFATLAVNVIAATYPILAVAAAFTGLYLLYQRFRPEIEAIIAKFKELWNYLTPLKDFIANSLIMAWNDLKNAFQSIKSTFIEVYRTMQPYMPQLKQLAKWLGIVSLIIIGNVIVSLVAFVVIVAKVISWVAKVINWIVRFNGAMIRFYQGIWNAVWNAIAAIGRFASSFRLNINAVINWFKGLKNKILSTLGNVGSWLYNAGKDLIQGFINGIKDMFGSVKNTLGELTSKLTDWKGPVGKDKILLQRSGELVMGGFVKGLENMYGKTQQSLGMLTDSLAGSVTSNTNIYGNININDRASGNYFISKIDRNQQLTGLGLSIR